MWWGIVGWDRSNAGVISQTQTSPPSREAIIDGSHSRTGTPSALNTLASSAPRSSSSGADVSGPQQGLCRCGRPGHRRRRACCGPQSVEIDENFGSTLYAADERAALPAEAVAASPGCGNPTAVAGLRDGERVFDLGSGGGIDVPLSARRVGPNGKAYGLDMTDEMLTLASPT